LLVDKETGKYKDEEMADFASEMWAEGASFFCYQSDSADSLSSCCFDGSQKVLTRSSTGHVQLTTFKELLDGKYSDVARNLTVYHNGSWKAASRVKLPKRPLYKITTANKKTIIVTDNHINPTMRGDVVTTDLSTDDYLMFSTLPVDSVKEQDQHLTYEEGYLIGLFAGDGSITERKDCNSCEVVFSLNHDKNDKSLPILKKALEQLNIDREFLCYDSKNNVYFVKNTSRELEQFIHHWVNNGHADSKAYNLNCLEQSIEFRKGILDGHYDSDGGNSNRIYSISKDLIEGLEAICTSLGIQTIIDCTDRTDEAVEIRGETFKRNYPLYCIRWYDCHNKRSMGDSYRVINNSIYFRIISIEPYESDDNSVYCLEVKDVLEPYFTLPNGIITHNCRLKNGIEDNTFSYTLGAGGVETGSKAVITLNLNRITQDWSNADTDMPLKDYVKIITQRVHKYLTAFNEKLWDDYNAGLLTIYKAGFIDLDKQYLTVGVNGLVESAEFLKIKVDPKDKDYQTLAEEVLGTIEQCNKEDRTPHTKFNTEFVPAENAAVKFYNWDKRDGYIVPTTRNLYNSYFYVVEDTTINPVEKFFYQGKGFADRCSGGVALHNNLEEHLTKGVYRKLMDIAVKAGCNYWTYNIKNTICNDCGFISKHTLDKCPKCGSTNLDYATRIIGYLKRVSNFSEARQKEEHIRAYGKVDAEHDV
jgi:predicted Zn-ribbon and HTH transcriptional regulator